MSGKIRTGFYGGSFNPLHEGHLALADFLISHRLVEECWFIVSPQNPLKETADPSDALSRFEAVQHQLINHPQCSVSDIEFNLSYPSYTAQTLRHAEKLYPNREFVLVIGGDNLDLFEKWKDYQYLLDNYDILVYPRTGYSNTIPEGWNRVKMLNAPKMDISSTQIRAAKNNF